jgi:importin subunit alpha-1
MAGDNHRIRDIIINTGAINPIAALLEAAEPESSFLRNVSWTLSNLCRGRPPPANNKIQKAIKALGKTLVQNNKEEILTDVCWALSYISDGGEDNI